MATNLEPLSVGELTQRLKRTIETAFGLVRVRGEVSGYKRAASGHVYFAVKDEAAVLDAVAWRGVASRFGFRPEDGLEVICTGKLTTYPGRSRYQIVVEHLEPAGAGALMALFEERKRRLGAEGLFEQGRKRPIPYLPGVIGVVTSPTGAVIRDILHRLDERFPRRVLLWPVAVQGEGAAEGVAAAIRGFGALLPSGPVPRPDLLIVARGGGSIEDLWAFNEEAVARAAAECPIPLISAVGHETDTTLIDFVADRRAPTPTAAAEMAVPVRHELRAQASSLSGRLGHGVERALRDLDRHLGATARGLIDPRQAVLLAAQRLDDQGERLARAWEARLERWQARLMQAGLGLRPPRQALAEARTRLDYRGERLWAGIDARLRDAALRLEGGAGLLHTLSPIAVLERGYAVVRAAGSGAVLASAETARSEAAYQITFHDGTVGALRTDTPTQRKKRAEPAAPKHQGQLFRA